MATKLTRQPKGAFELEITIGQSEVAKTREEVILEAVKNAEIPGFRKGTAPRERVEPTLEKNKIYEKVIQHLIPRAYLEAIQEHHLRPLLNPRVQLKSVKEGQDWTIIATSSEAPEVKITGYQDEVRKTLAVDNLWVPAKGDPNKEEEPHKDKKLNIIVDHLLTAFPVEPADMLIEEEANHSLSRLIDQTQQLGLTVEQYLASTGKTPEALRAEYSAAAKRNLQTEFLLDAIARDLKIEIPDKEVDEVVNAAVDPESKKTLDTPSQRASIKEILGRRRVLDSLLAIT